MLLLKLPITPTPSLVFVDKAIVGPGVVDQTTPLLEIDALPSPEIVEVTEALVAAIFDTVVPEMDANIFPSKGLLLSSVLEHESKKNSIKNGRIFFITKLKCFYQGKLIRRKSLV